MAQFTLIVRSGEAVTRDPRIYHFPTAQDARDATVETIRTLLAGRADALDGKQIEIADETGHPVTVVHPYDVAPVRWN
ncbi:MAG: hypothetical protein WDM86_01995 [Rhizomicrobium sp.]